MTRKIKVAAHRIPILVSTVAMILLVLTGCGGGVGNQILPSNTPIPSVAANTTPVTVGQTTTGGHTNGIFTSVTVCGPDILPVGQNPPYGPPPTPTCTTIPNILVDTGSVGLRLLESGQVDALNLPLVTDSNNNPLQDCVQFADFSFVWGPVARATVHIAGEVAAQVPLDNEIAGPDPHPTLQSLHRRTRELPFVLPGRRCADCREHVIKPGSKRHSGCRELSAGLWRRVRFQYTAQSVLLLPVQPLLGCLGPLGFTALEPCGGLRI